MAALVLAVCSHAVAAAVSCAGGITRNTCMKQYASNNLRHFVIRNFTTANTTDGSPECCAACAAEPKCTFWMWNHGTRKAEFNPAMCWVTRDTDPQPKVPPNAGCDIGVLPTPAPTPAPVPPPAGAKNVLYLLVDDMRTQMTPYGHSFMQTPNLQELADSAFVFDQAHVQSQMCVPTRNSFMTGRRPEETTVFNDGIGVATVAQGTLRGFRAAPGGDRWTTLPGYFKKHGYFVTGVGKSFHPNQPRNFDQPKSWSEELPYYYPTPSPCPSKEDVWCPVPDNSTFEDTLILEEAKRRLDYATNASAVKRPFFIAVGFHKPHTPYRMPQSFYDAQPPLAQTAVAVHQNFPENTTGLAWFSCQAEGKQYPINHTVPYPVLVQQELRRAYYAAVSFTDSNIGKLMTHVDKLGLSNSTLVVFHSDHGYQLGERNVYCKETNFNLATHVPLMIRAPFGTFAGAMGKRTGRLVEIVDIMPTLIDMAGLPAFNLPGEPPLGGKTLAPLIRATGSGVNLPSSGGVDKAFSQYGRSRCLENAFYTVKDAKEAKVPCTPVQYMGYSVRTPDFRLTEWTLCNVTSGRPLWNTTGPNASLHSLELYAHPGGEAESDDYDTSETENLAYKKEQAGNLATLRKLLRSGFKLDGQP
eukprot:Hpha_TRINITY_DN22911_c0_g1::TRINITY_DN22911_c0_g1_i1::g.154133::m.154133/K01136/IDS; iduronate 2-sulfatase